jgi:hypothetical protein
MATLSGDWEPERAYCSRHPIGGCPGYGEPEITFLPALDHGAHWNPYEPGESPGIDPQSVVESDNGDPHE